MIEVDMSTGDISDMYKEENRKWAVFTLGSTTVRYYNSLEEAEKTVVDLDRCDSTKHYYIIAELVDEVADKPQPKIPPVYKTKVIGAILDSDGCDVVIKINGITKQITKEHFEKHYKNCFVFDKKEGYKPFILSEFKEPVVLYSIVKDKDYEL